MIGNLYFETKIKRKTPKKRHNKKSKFSHSSSNKIYVIYNIYPEENTSRAMQHGGKGKSKVNIIKQNKVPYIYTYITGHSQNIYYYETTGEIYTYIYIKKQRKI